MLRINAAGPGSNVGAAVVYRFAGAILRRAWDDTGDPKYFAALEDKAERILRINVRYADDPANRILVEDEQRLRALQKPEGWWGFGGRSGG